MKIENDIDLRGIKRIGEICGLTLKLMLDQAEPGMSTRDLDDIGRDFLTKTGAISAPIHAYGFPGYTCISLNDEAAHGIPRKDRRMKPGDLLNVDVSAILEGYWGDTGATIILPPARQELKTLCTTTRRALQLAIDLARPRSAHECHRPRRREIRQAPRLPHSAPTRRPRRRASYPRKTLHPQLLQQT